jgi:hypothetical protein
VSRHELIVNLAAARSLGVSIPAATLALALGARPHAVPASSPVARRN